MKLTFTKDEVLAIYKMAKMMAEADGVVLHKELEEISYEIQKIGLDEIKYEEIIVAGEKMASIEALNIAFKMDEAKKKFLSVFLGYLIAVDDDVDDSELALWTFIIKVANLPKMNIRQAVDLYHRY